MRAAAQLVASVLFAAGCATGDVEVFATCQLDMVLTPAAAAPGEIVSASGGPYTIVRDTVVQVGGVRAEVTVVSREGCAACDECRLLADCAPCGPCFGEDLDDETRVSCFGDPLDDPPIAPACDLCVESFAFVVPATAPRGLTTVLVVNGNGASSAVPFEVLGLPVDTGDTADTSDTSDTGVI